VSPRTDRTHAAWVAALEELEQLAAVTVGGEGAGGAGAGAGAGVVSARPLWQPPRDLGPLPADLAERAAAVVEVQRGALARLEAARAAVLRHLGVVRTVEASHQPERPVYLDATG
jgi:hypothetical protein